MTPDPPDTRIAKPRKFWRSSFENSDAWHSRVRIGRTQIGFHVYRHRYPTTSDRWVFQPFLVFDRAVSS